MRMSAIDGFPLRGAVHPTDWWQKTKTPLDLLSRRGFWE